jgi:hypothetical protein
MAVIFGSSAGSSIVGGEARFAVSIAASPSRISAIVSSGNSSGDSSGSSSERASGWGASCSWVLSVSACLGMEAVGRLVFKPDFVRVE